MRYPDFKWYGEPEAQVREGYYRKAKEMNLDSYTAPESVEPLSTRLWRCYDQKALDLLAVIAKDPRQAEILIKGTDLHSL